MASTTSTEQSGLFSHMLPAFKQATGLDTKVVAVGTGQAIDMARRGDADVLFVHDSRAEEKFVAEGFAARRYPVMYNDFVLIGPKSDPARIAASKDILDALKKIETTQAPLSIAFLAGRAAPISIENPRQISAYQYPEQYGARSPTFSRAGLVRLGQDEVLFISGTASIVGHATLHPGDVVAQTRETMTNIEAVLAEANRLTRQTRFDLASLHYKVYVRHATDLVPIRAELERIVGSALNAIYLQADVCRQDLLLEIEATAAHPVFMPDHSH